ncbi:MAG TPA: hypothetical protein DDW33_15445 [Ktedonobacter sp.]|jgi:hypothetical protein|nr:hypothetical protein [Ktedonobacter sp.]HAT44112.1 hypothetical protein [Ktedonobacter sp.]HBE27068.1 hypothetical protein [Ktedonobacter sp.]HBE28496.1 hypothetical protein [Ktedonobacter sp.]HCF86817.1 hypothetical protein [Ktedonobacter sp.]
MEETATTERLVKQKLAVFDRLQTEFEECFRYIQDVHGQQRFSTFSVSDAVHYLHALWICECKDRLLSIYKNFRRYEGRHCLELLQGWQEGEIANVVDFLYRKLDMLPVADITRQLHQALYHDNDKDLARRLEHGRLILLNRGMNLMHVLDAIFALKEDQIVKEAQFACMQYGHHPSQIAEQIAMMDTPLYSFIPHRVLAQRNMMLMNKMGANVMSKPADQPGQRSWRVLEPTEPLSPFAEHVIEGYLELTSPLSNNIKGHRFIDRPEHSETLDM